MEKYQMNELLMEDKNLYKQYIEDWKARTVREDNLDNSIEAFYYLMRDDILKQRLSQAIIIQTADLVNKRNPFIINGWRRSNDYMHGTGIKIPNAEKIPEIMEKLLVNYHTNILNDPFLKEAILHIGIIMTQPFEDGNHRTASLITNYNLMKQNIAPIIITKDVKKVYDELIYTNNLDAFAHLLKELSIRESNYIYNMILKNKESKNR